MNPEIFIGLSTILVVTILVTGLMCFLKQPLIIGYILSGIIVGPLVLDIVISNDVLSVFSQIGVALLLFMVGLSLNPKVIKEVGKVSLITGIGQVLFTTIIGFVMCVFLRFSIIVSLYISVALAFSSTIIIMKLLSDKKDLDTLYGRISVGFLIVQDFIAIAILLIISSLQNGHSFSSLAIGTIIKGIIGSAILFVVSVYILPHVTKVVAKSQEYLMLFSIGWCFSISALSHFFNFSIEAGALFAGISLSISPYHYEISSKMKPLRDFFLILFFIILGSQMVFSNILENITIIIILSLFVLIGNPLIVLIIMGFMGYTKRTSFLAGLTVAQISEFSLIVVSMGVSAGHVSNDILSLVTTIGLITFAGSSYMILYSNKLYSYFSKGLTIFEKKGKKIDGKNKHKHTKYNIILFGYNRIGFDILESLKKIKSKFLVVDYDPEVISKLTKKKYTCMYGDANDFELLNDLNLSTTKMVISTIPLLETNLLLINKVREENKKAIILVVSHQIDEAMRLYEEGATYVLMPHFLGGKQFSMMIENHKLSTSKFLKEKILHLEHLDYRKKLGQDHPRHEDF